MGYFTCVMSSVTGNLSNKYPKWLVEQNSSYSDYFNAISGFTLNSRAPGGPVTDTRRLLFHLIIFFLNYQQHKVGTSGNYFLPFVCFITFTVFTYMFGRKCYLICQLIIMYKIN